MDNIAGATVTSTALKTAIAQAIEKAGGDIAAFQKPVPEKIKKVAGITKGSADLIIVGAGGAGLSAAVTMSQNNNQKPQNQNQIFRLQQSRPPL